MNWNDDASTNRCEYFVWTFIFSINFNNLSLVPFVVVNFDDEQIVAMGKIIKSFLLMNEMKLINNFSQIFLKQTIKMQYHLI